MDLNTNFTDPEVIGNYIEAAFWVTVALVLGIKGRNGRQPLRKLAFLASVIFFSFGLSDLVEAQTGAWWRPFWLFLWKGFCLVGLALSYLKYRKIKKALEATPIAVPTK